MKKGMTILSSVILLSMLLAACNTDTKDVPETPATIPDEQLDQTSPEDTNADDQQPTSTPEEKQPEENTDNTTKSLITYTSKGQKVQQDVQTSTSEQSNYSIQHTADFTLVAEEPNKDLLYLKADDTISMGIEVLNKADVSFEDVKTNAIETMAAIAPEGKYGELDLTNSLKDQKDLLQFVGYETVLEAEKVQIIVLEHEGKIIKLTIYDTPKADLSDAFLQMGLTIQ
ncbi:chemotaxis protein [Solibacillus cecembensis]|uniref:chemotaxis protein n=1 Tax=Solibacillus cecembensis TaxID=459347 RepID=UPI003CFD5F9F